MVNERAFSYRAGAVLDPRTKLVVGLMVVIASIAVGTVEGEAMIFCTLLVLSALVRVDLRSSKALLVSLIAFAVSAFLLRGIAQADFYGDAQSFHGILYSPSGMHQALLLWLQIGCIIVTLTLFVATTRPVSMSEGIESLLRPLSKMGVPVHIGTLTFIIALRFLPIMTDEFMKLSTAQTSRGAAVIRSGMVSRTRAVMSLLIPMFIASLTRANDLAQAMESRGFDGLTPGTPIRVLRMGRADVVAILLCVALIACAIVVPMLVIR